MNMPPPSDSESSSFNGFGSYRRKRAPGGSAPKGAPRSFRRIPREEFPDEGPSDGDESAAEHPVRSYGGRKPFGKKPFGKKPFGFKKGPGFRKPFHPREFDTIEDGEAPAPAEDAPFFHERLHRHDSDHEAPRSDRSFKHAPRHHGDRPDRDGDFKPFGRKPFGKKKSFGKKPFGKPFSKGPRPFRERPDDGESADFGAPRPLRRPYGAPADGEFSSAPDFDAAPGPGRCNPFGKKPFGKKPFGKKPFGKKPFGKPFGKKPFGKKPFGKGKPFGKKPFGKKPGKRPGPRD